MPQKSYGKMRGTRQKLKSRGPKPINAYLHEFKKDDHVHIDLVPSSPIQHPRFKGLTGIVLEKRGRNYIVHVKDGDKMKKVFLRPEHMKLQQFTHRKVRVQKKSE